MCLQFLMYRMYNVCNVSKYSVKQWSRHMKWWQACIKSSGWLGFCRFHQIPKGASNPKRLGAHSYWHWRCLGLKSPLRPFPIFWKTTGYFGVRPKSNLHYSVIAITSEVFEQIFPDYMYCGVTTVARLQWIAVSLFDRWLGSDRSLAVKNAARMLVYKVL